MLVVQSIKSIGENNLTSEFLSKLENKFTQEEWIKTNKKSLVYKL